jgi:homoserine dehydrogenase
MKVNDRAIIDRVERGTSRIGQSLSRAANTKERNMMKIGMLGLGTVGAGTAQILLDPIGRHHLLGQVEIARVGVKSIDKPRSVTLPAGIVTDDLESVVNDPDIGIIVEVMGGIEPARTLILKAIAQGKHIVTANKALISRYGDEIFTAANEAGVYVMLEAAVGGGIPVIQPLKQSLSVNRINKVTGIINGTTNYILTRMTEEGGEFGDILADAQALGYAEADPTADVDGLDAGDKIAILAALAFGDRIKRADVTCEGIRKVGATDIAYADTLGYVIKLLAIAEKGSDQKVAVRVHPTLLAKGHPLASVNGVFNAILVEGEPLGRVMLFGPGAGAGATASAVVSDIVAVVGATHSQTGGDVMNPLLRCPHQHYADMADLSTLVGRFYVRFQTLDLPGTIGHIGTAFGNHQVSIESIVQTSVNKSGAEIVVVTGEVTEANFQQALQAIEQLPAIKAIPAILKVVA